MICDEGNCQGLRDILCCECAVGHGAFDDYHDDTIICFMKRTPRLTWINYNDETDLQDKSQYTYTK